MNRNGNKVIGPRPNIITKMQITTGQRTWAQGPNLTLTGLRPNQQRYGKTNSQTKNGVYNCPSLHIVEN